MILVAILDILPIKTRKNNKCIFVSRVFQKYTILLELLKRIKDDRQDLTSVVDCFSELFGSFDDFHDGITSLDFPSFFLGNDANAWPAVLFDGKGPFQAVKVSSLIFSLFLGSLVAVLEGLNKKISTFLDFSLALSDEGVVAGL